MWKSQDQRSNFRGCAQLGISIFIVIVCASCLNQQNLVNENNRFYNKGIELVRLGKYHDAIMAFRRCLDRSPNSDKAHLQLALIYEDHLHDYPQALICYDRYLKKSSNSESIDIVQKWRIRAEQKYYSILHKVYGSTVDAKAIKSKPVPSGHVSRSRTKRSSDVALKPPTSPQKKTQSEWRKLIALAAYEKEPAAAKKELNGRYYTVRDGDTLVRISRALFGNDKYWKSIYAQNKDAIPLPNQLRVGQRLKIPNIAGQRRSM